MALAIAEVSFKEFPYKDLIYFFLGRTSMKDKVINMLVSIKEQLSMAYAEIVQIVIEGTEELKNRLGAKTYTVFLRDFILVAFLIGIIFLIIA